MERIRASRRKFAGRKNCAELGMNAALLFGRQKAAAHHESSGDYHYRKGKYPHTAYVPFRPHDTSRNRSVIVPNIGGFAGLSYNFPNAKISAGYRGDFFFSAMDGGLDTRKLENVGFCGPFASVSIGLGG